ncbi:type III pantothenate kinase [SAR202 cluster bacterium AC-647-N09_OGT_505m]|nr:type III pantothenate kinase [SAR202 cluster bacterium AC-647-N09_OGT_505m]
MLLAIDVGNTNVTMGVFRNEELVATWRLATDTHKLPDEYALLIRSLLPLKGVAPEDIHSIAICSVVPPLTNVFAELGDTYFGVTPLVVGTGTRTGVRILYENPRDVGADRVVDAAAAFTLYGGPVIVVDFGTATVFDGVSRDGDYLGGAIASGINLTAEALFERTSQLRRVELIPPKTAIGRNTAASIQSGIIFGHVGMVESMVHRFKEELGEDTKVVATGGMASMIQKETSIFNAVNPELTLVGLRLIYDINTDAKNASGRENND